MPSCKFRRYPAHAHAAELDIMLGAFRDLCNAALQRNEAYRRQGKTLRHTERARDLRAVRDALVEHHTGGAGNYLAKRMALRCNSGPISFGLHDDGLCGKLGDDGLRKAAYRGG